MRAGFRWISLRHDGTRQGKHLYFKSLESNTTAIATRPLHLDCRPRQSNLESRPPNSLNHSPLTG